MNTKLAGIVLAIAALAGCASNRTPDVAGSIRTSLRQAGLNHVTVSQDRNKGVVSLAGDVSRDDDKLRAEQIAQPLANGQVVANEIAVLPNGDGSVAKNIDANLDKGIEANLDAALAQANIRGVSHTTKMGVVTLTGNVDKPGLRDYAARVATGVPYVQQVVNEIDVKNQPASSSSADRSR